MKSTYNLIAGTSVERLAALSDGVFAVALTLLVLDIHAPASASIHSEQSLWLAIVSLGPHLLVYAMTFMTLGIFWVGQQTQLNHLARTGRSLTWIHLAFLFAVSMMPFSTTLLASFTTYRIALLTYWLNILVLGITLLFSWICATGSAHLKQDVPPQVSTAIKRRILIAQGLYALGAALCFIDTFWSIGFIVAVQLNYAVAPRLPRLHRREVSPSR